MRLFATDRQKRSAGGTVVINIDEGYNGLKYLVELVKQIRPARHRNYKEAGERLRRLYDQLHNDKRFLFSLRRALLTQLLHSNFVPALTESGMVGSRGFLQELMKKLKHKLLPPLLAPDDVLYVINHIFYQPKDYIWINQIDHQLWIDFFKLIGIKVSVGNQEVLDQLNLALYILSQRTVTMALEKEIRAGTTGIAFNDYPFFELDKAVQRYLEAYRRHATETVEDALKQIRIAVKLCVHAKNEIAEYRRKNGTSLSQTFLLSRIEQHLDRVSLVIDILNNTEDTNAEEFFQYFLQVIIYEKKRNSIREFISANLAFLAYKITEHGGTRGQKYITATRKDYWAIMRQSMGGGFIVSFTALIKNLITKVPLAPFWQGFAYSVNYAAGFQMMHETRTTLATKQPAFTASALASNLDYFKENRKPDMYAVAITIARTSRSQIASFFGNLVIVFPIAYLLAFVYHKATGHLLLDPEKAMHTLVDQHPARSLSIMYASFTGFFLFLSGLIAGYVENGINYGKVKERLQNHPLFKNTLSSRKLLRVTEYVANNAGALIGNISLGFFLGMAGFIGHIFGLPFDIRHITIAAANSAIAFYTTGDAPGHLFLFTVFGGVLLIGLFNFLVSFSLAFFVAIKSRGIRMRDYPELATVLSKFFFRFPLDFFFPPRYSREVDEVKRRFRRR